MFLAVCLALLIWFIVLDVWFYNKTAFFDRTSSWVYKLPFGGIFAYFKYRK